MESHRESSADTLDPIAEEALQWVVRRLDAKAWSENDETRLRAWRSAAPEHDREYKRHEMIARIASQPQVHRDEAKRLQPAQAAESESDPELSAVREFLRYAEAPGLPVGEVLGFLDSAIAALRALLAPGQTQHRRLLAQVLTRRADLRQREHGTRSIDEALSDYDEAESQLLGLLPEQHPTWRHDLADLCTSRGATLMSAGSAAAAAQALTCFDRALEIRLPLKASGDFWDHYHLVAAWMNRGDALFRVGGPDLTDALAAYDEAFRAFGDPGVLRLPLFRRRYIVACLNQGGMFLARNAAGDGDSAIQRADDAIGFLSASTDEGEATIVLKGAAWAMRAAGLARKESAGDREGALSSARVAVGFVAPLEKQNPRAAEVGVKARHAQCGVLAKRIAENISPSAREVFVSEAVSATYAGLDVAQHWRSHQLADVRSLSAELFRFGLGLVECYQPHALGDFCLRYLDPERSEKAVAWHPEWRPLAINAVNQAILRLLNERIAKSSNGGASDYYLDALNALCPAIDRLRRIESAGK